MNVPSRLIAGALLLAAPVAFAQSAGATASANIITSLSLVNNTGLAFGNIVTGSSISTVVVSNAGVRTVGGGDVTLAGGTPTAASFTANGTGTQTYTITLPGSAATLSDGATHTMTVDTFTCTVSPLTAGVLTAGAQTFGVGGTLHVAASQVPGAYTGTFNVSIAYN